SEISPTNCNEIDSSIFLLENESNLNIVETTITCINPDAFFQSTNSYTFDKNGDLILKPIDPPCPEGCAFKFTQIE
ncbi:MAG: hypothetical protein R3250_07400, partial [Melioribacteraceae bacterium]|nr:hypothetical protein [Melioribacteraceae bacterium]